MVLVVGDKTVKGAKSLTSFRQALFFQELGFDMYDVIIYEKDGSLTNKGKKVVSEFGARTNIWRYANGKGFSTKDKIAYEHPAIFPEKLAEDHILSWSDPGDLVLDPFGGGGTTAKAAQLLGREWVLIDAVKEYCDIAKKRLDGLDACKQ